MRKEWWKKSKIKNTCGKFKYDYPKLQGQILLFMLTMGTMKNVGLVLLDIPIFQEKQK